MIFSKNVILTASSLAIISTLSWFIFSDNPSQVISNTSAKSSTTKSSETANNSTQKIDRETRESWSDQTTKSLNYGSASDFARKMQRASSGNLLDISSAILAAHKEQPADTIAWLEELSLELTALDAHDRAALL